MSLTYGAALEVILTSINLILPNLLYRYFTAAWNVVLSMGERTPLVSSLFYIFCQQKMTA
jgi:hypothetical protein